MKMYHVVGQASLRATLKPVAHKLRKFIRNPDEWPSSPDPWGSDDAGRYVPISIYDDAQATTETAIVYTCIKEKRLSTVFDPEEKRFTTTQIVAWIPVVVVASDPRTAEAYAESLRLQGRRWAVEAASIREALQRVLVKYV